MGGDMARVNIGRRRRGVKTGASAHRVCMRTANVLKLRAGTSASEPGVRVVASLRVGRAPVAALKQVDLDLARAHVAVGAGGEKPVLSQNVWIELGERDHRVKVVVKRRSQIARAAPDAHFKGLLTRYGVLKAHGHLEREVVHRPREVAEDLKLEPATRGVSGVSQATGCGDARAVDGGDATSCTTRTPTSS